MRGYSSICPGSREHSRRLPGLFNLFNPDLVPLRNVLREIRGGAGRRTLLVPVPSRLLRVPAWLAAKAGIRLPLDADNLRAQIGAHQGAGDALLRAGRPGQAVAAIEPVGRPTPPSRTGLRSSTSDRAGVAGSWP
jgi:hypothetical protein